MDNSNMQVNSHDASASLSAAKDIASTTAANVKRELRKGVEEVSSVVKDAYCEVSQHLDGATSAAVEKATATAKDAAKGLEQEFRRSPVLTMAVAFGVGALAAHLFRRAQ